MESQWQSVEDVSFTAVVIIVTHVDEQGLFIIKVLIELQTIIYFLEFFSHSFNLSEQLRHFEGPIVIFVIIYI